MEEVNSGVLSAVVDPLPMLPGDVVGGWGPLVTVSTCVGLAELTCCFPRPLTTC